MSHSVYALHQAPPRHRPPALVFGVPADVAAHLGKCADLDRAHLVDHELWAHGVQRGRKGRSRKTLKPAILRRLAGMLAAFARHRARSLNPDRLSEHMRRDLGLTNHVEQAR